MVASRLGRVDTNPSLHSQQCLLTILRRHAFSAPHAVHDSVIASGGVVETDLYMYSFPGVWSNFHCARINSEIIEAREILRDGNMCFSVWVDH